MKLCRSHRPTVKGVASHLKSAADSAGATSSAIKIVDCDVESNRVAKMFKRMPQLSRVSTFSGQTGLCHSCLLSILLHCFTCSEVTRNASCFQHGCVVRMLFSGRRTWPALWLQYAARDAI